MPLMLGLGQAGTISNLTHKRNTTTHTLKLYSCHLLKSF